MPKKKPAPKPATKKPAGRPAERLKLTLPFAEAVAKSFQKPKGK